MELIADILLASAALGAGFYCFILGRRLKKFNTLENGVGGAVAVLSAQVDDLTKTLESAQQTAANSAATLTDLNLRADQVSRKLDLQMAALHDIPNEPDETQPAKQDGADDEPPAQPVFMRRSVG